MILKKTKCTFYILLLRIIRRPDVLPVAESVAADEEGEGGRPWSAASWHKSHSDTDFLSHLALRTTTLWDKIILVVRVCFTTGDNLNILSRTREGFFK